MKKSPALIVFAACLMAAFAAVPCRYGFAQVQAPAAEAPQKIIIDTDIGDDIDDAFALALALSSDRVQVLGVTTAWGDTDLRARLVERFLIQTGHSDIPVAAGLKTASNNVFTQTRWADAFPEPAKGWPNAIDFILDTIRRYPGQVTLVAIAPLSNVGALIDKDPSTFRKLKRVVMMGGSIYRGYGDLGYLPDRGPDAEYNIKMDVPSAQKLFASGVPIEMMPLDSTQLKLDEVLRMTMFSQGTPITNTLAQLYEQWSESTQYATPTLYDAMAVAEAIDAHLCPTTPMHIRVDDKGYTLVDSGKPNANVCLHSDSDQFFHFYIPMVLGEHGDRMGEQPASLKTP
jgi:inosine-uridine nucleoside N-ribohydrolase